MKHYLYRHVRNDKNVPLYIGIGTKNDYNWSCWELEYSRAYSSYHRGKLWNNIVKKIENNYIIEILIESDDYTQIKEKEREFIKLYGRIDLGTGTLANLTDGGEGLVGTIRTDEWKENISKAHRGKPKLKLRGRKKSEEAKRKSSESQKGKQLTQEHKDRIKAARKFQVITPETMEKLRIFNTGRKDTPEVRKYKSEVAKARGVSQAFRDVCKKPVQQYTKEGILIAEYESMATAERATGIRSCTMRRHCDGEVKINGHVKYVWKWKEGK